MRRLTEHISDNAEFLAPVALALGFYLSTLLHHLQKDDLQAYTNSKLIPLEFFLLICSGFALISVLVFVSVYLFKRRWHKVFWGVTSLVSTYFLISFGLYTDASTLIYMT